jgi:hypothetical protein
VVGADVYECTWQYHHKFHPTITTLLNGLPAETPAMIEHDHLGILKKPSKLNFYDDDPILFFNHWQIHKFPGWLYRKAHLRLNSTSQARSQLWKAWKKSALDGVTMRYLDERLLHKEPVLRPYWSMRNRGDLEGAEMYLNTHSDAIIASVDLDGTISGWSPLAIKFSDLRSFGQGGDSNARTRTPGEFEPDDGSLQVMAVDTGTWPNEVTYIIHCE